MARLRPSLGAAGRSRPWSRTDLPFIRVDAVLFDAILSNILANIVDHTPPDAPVAIRIERAEPGRVLISIEDGGPGVPEADLPFVFEKFQRALAGPAGPGAGWASASRSSVGWWRPWADSVVGSTIDRWAGSASTSASKPRRSRRRAPVGRRDRRGRP